MLLNARRARRASTLFPTAAFGVPVFATDRVIGTWMSGAGPSATYGFKTHDTFIGTCPGPATTGPPCKVDGQTPRFPRGPDVHPPSAAAAH